MDGTETSEGGGNRGGEGRGRKGVEKTRVVEVLEPALVAELQAQKEGLQGGVVLGVGGRC